MEVAHRYRWTARLPLALVLVSLLSLALLPIVEQRRIGQLQQEISGVADPARALVTQIQLALAREAAGSRGYLLTHDPQYVTAHLEARSARERAYVRLLPLARRLGPAVYAQALELDRRIRPADRMLDAVFSGRMSTAEFLDQLDDQQARFLEVTATAARLDQAVSQAIAARTAQIQRTARLGTVVTVLLVLLALVAALLVARLGRRYRSLAERLDLRARQEVALREELERLTETRARLIRGFSHDVKNPLGAADGFLQLLEEGIMGPLAGKQVESVGRARRAIESALDLIEDLLSLARAEAGELEVAQEPTDVRAAAEEASDAYRAQATAKGLELRLELPERLPLVESDAGRIRQILGNLLSNAVKYTPRGGVTVRVAERDGSSAPAPGRWIAVDVSDTGPGISPEQQRLLFHEFRRLETAGTTRGAGIGLAISQSLARALGGDVTVQSEVGRGSTFTLWLPLRPVPEHPPAGAGAPAG